MKEKKAVERHKRQKRKKNALQLKVINTIPGSLRQTNGNNVDRKFTHDRTTEALLPCFV
jgi:hypothetical protein